VYNSSSHDISTQTHGYRSLKN